MVAGSFKSNLHCSLHCDLIIFLAESTKLLYNNTMFTTSSLPIFREEVSEEVKVNEAVWTIQKSIRNT